MEIGVPMYCQWECTLGTPLEEILNVGQDVCSQCSLYTATLEALLHMDGVTEERVH